MRILTIAAVLVLAGIVHAQQPPVFLGGDQHAETVQVVLHAFPVKSQ